MRIVLSAVLVLGCLLGVTARASAQGSIADGDLTWAYVGFGALTGNANFFPTGAGNDHVYQQWWWYRVGGTGPETVFPTPTSQTYQGNQATLTHALPQFDAQLQLTVTDGTANASGSLVQQMAVTNTSGGPITLHLFSYVDFDVLGAGGDAAAFVGGDPTHMRVTDTTGAYSDFLGVDADAYQVTIFATLRTALQDATTTNLNNTGVPFGPGDFTGAFQWTLDLAAGEEMSIYVVITCNEAAEPPVIVTPDPHLRRGDCNNDGSRNLVDAIFLLGFLFPAPGSQPSMLVCLDACDANDDGSLNLVDAINLLNALFGQPPIPLPEPQQCGPDTTLSNLTCLAHTACP